MIKKNLIIIIIALVPAACSVVMSSCAHLSVWHQIELESNYNTATGLIQNSDMEIYDHLIFYPFLRSIFYFDEIDNHINACATLHFVDGILYMKEYYWDVQEHELDEFADTVMHYNELYTSPASSNFYVDGYFENDDWINDIKDLLEQDYDAFCSWNADEQLMINARLSYNTVVYTINIENVVISLNQEVIERKRGIIFDF